jgi:hypothetical protein
MTTFSPIASLLGGALVIWSIGFVILLLLAQNMILSATPSVTSRWAIGVFEAERLPDISPKRTLLSRRWPFMSSGRVRSVPVQLIQPISHPGQQIARQFSGPVLILVAATAVKPAGWRSGTALVLRVSDRLRRDDLLAGAQVEALG